MLHDLATAFLVHCIFWYTFLIVLFAGRRNGQLNTLCRGSGWNMMDETLSGASGISHSSNIY